MKFNKFFKFFSTEALYYLAIFIISIVIYFLILTIGIPTKLSQILLSQDITGLFIGSVIFLYFAYLPSGWIGTLTSFSGTLILFAIQLSGLWRSGLNLSGYVMAGLLTMTDTVAYYSSALNLLEGGIFSNIASWRPLAHGVLASLLGLTGQNFQITIALLVLITAIACFLLASEVQRSHGTGAAALLLTILFFYYRIYLGTASTESLGLGLGAIGLALLWRGTIEQGSKCCLLGLFILTLALNTRAGTFFILPALILWGGWLFRGSSRLSGRFLLGGFSVVFLGFLCNSLIFKLVAPADATPFSNFSYSLYGLITGGNWQSVFVQHPELKNFNDVQASQKVYELVLEALRAEPLGLVRGFLRAWKNFLWDDFVFSFISSAKVSKVNIILQLLTLVALFNAYRQRQTPICSFILVTTTGILLSVPFIPPWDAGMRPYMATIPFIAILPALGLAVLAHKMSWPRLLLVPTHPKNSSFLWIFGLALALLTTLGTISTKLLSHPPQFAEISCSKTTEIIYFRNSGGSSINLVADKSIRQTNVPNITISDFRKILEQYRTRQIAHPGVPQLTKELSQLSPNTTIINKINLETGEMVWVVTQSPSVSQGIAAACGKFAVAPHSNLVEDSYLRYIFYADSITGTKK
ncbi:hypothetical protein [Aphanothece sacrum]|nr:hypothetical protein [Aphanothece sacrum]GBF86901.1 membrane protein [Aphanothece sacrum FPU3]